MSGRGRNNSGRGNYHFNRSSGRGSGQSNNRRNNRSRNSGRGSNNSSQSSEMKFIPHYSGKQQVVTYDTVRDHIVQQIQKTFKYGNDMAKAIREMEYNNDNLSGVKPTRQLVSVPI